MTLIDYTVKLAILDCIEPKHAALHVRLLRGDLAWSLAGIGGTVRKRWMEERDFFVAKINRALERHDLTADIEPTKPHGALALVIRDCLNDYEIWEWI